MMENKKTTYLNKLLEKVREKKLIALKNQEYEKAADLRTTEKNLLEKIEQRRMNLNELKYKAAKVSDEKFGRNNPVTAPMLKLKEEIEEVLECIDKGEDPQVEFADCFLLLLDAYRKYYGDDVDMQTLIDVSSNKLDIVAERKWGKPNEHGVYKHIKE